MTEDQALEVRALMTLFAKSDWKDIHVRTETIELFLANDDGCDNPMAGSAFANSVRAPHLATIVALALPGTAVAIGEKVGTIELLSDQIDLIASISGIVAKTLAATGDLVDYDQPLLSLSS